MSSPSTWISRAPAAAFRRERLRFRTVWAWLWGLFLPAASAACNRQPSESDVVHDHIRLGQHQIVAVACIVVSIGARHMEHAGSTESGETAGCSSGGGELSPGGGSAEMISDGRSDTNRKVLVKRVGEHLLPTAQARGLWRPGPPVAAPGTGNRHLDLFCHLIPGQALVTKLQDLLAWRRDEQRRRDAW